MHDPDACDIYCGPSNILFMTTAMVTFLLFGLSAVTCTILAFVRKRWLVAFVCSGVLMIVVLVTPGIVTQV